jgi:hypothetical protein
MTSKKAWHSMITFLKPYEYVDELLSGPFKKWKPENPAAKINAAPKCFNRKINLENIRILVVRYSRRLGLVQNFLLL